MKKYEMFRPDGEKAEVGTMIMAHRIIGEFKAASAQMVEKFDNNEPFSDDFYASCDAVFGRWDQNCTTIEQMEADPEFQEESKRSWYALRLLQIAEMASQYADVGS